MLRILFFLLAISFFPSSIFATTEFVVLDGITHSVNSGIHTVSGKGQTPILFERKQLPEKFEKITFDGVNYSGPVYFIWQPVGESFDPNKYNMGLSLEQGSFFLPSAMNRNTVESIGIIFPVDSVSFSDIHFGMVTFGEKLSRLTESHTPLLPSTINLISPKYLGLTPLTKVLGSIVICLSLIFLFYKKHVIIIICLSGWFLWDIFYAIDQKEIIKTTYTSFVAPNEPEKQYFDLGDQYGFAKSIAKYHRPNVGYYAPRMWPFYVNFFYHTYPTKTLWQGSGASIIAVASVPWTLSGGTLNIDGTPLSGEYSILEKYSETSYLFSRK